MDNKSNKTEVILLKLSDDKFNGDHPNGYNEGFSTTGFFTKKPTVGERFGISTMRDWFLTSLVSEILIENSNEIKFKTINSTYLLKFID